jgi:Cu/Ag efflux protein CusF
MSRFSQMSGRVLSAAVCVALVAGVGCSKRETPSTQTKAPSATYTTRGIVIELPDPAKPTSEFKVYHERIADFVNAKGEKVGMNEMLMPFPLAKTISLDGIAVGDKVELTFDIWWEGRSGSWLTTKLTELPVDTTLELKEDPLK